MEAAAGRRLKGRPRPGAPEIAFAALWLVQGAIAALTPPVADEAYYRLWAARPGLGYLDHPPGVAWWLALGGGAGRALTWLAAGSLWWALAWSLRRALGDGWRWLPAFALATPLGFSMALVVTPDAPATLAWLGVVAAVAHGRPAAVGVALAAALWSKSTVLVALPGLCWALGARQAVQAVSVAACLYVPHLCWSWTHGGLPWTFQGSRALGTGTPLAFAAGQILVLGPVAARAIWRSWGQASGAVGRRLARMSWPTALGWLGLACVYRAELNWAALAWPSALVLVVSQAQRPSRLVGWGAAWTLAAALGWVGVARFAPMGWGPPRDGARLAQCLEHVAPRGPWVAARYQEAALLRAAGRVVGYQGAARHRRSEFDRGLAPRQRPSCGYWYLARADRLPACPGAVHPSAGCGLDLAWCACPTEPAAQRVTPGVRPAYAPGTQAVGGGPR